MIAKDVVVLFIEERKYEHVTNNDVEWVVDFCSPPPYYPYERVVYYIQSRRLWYSEVGNSNYSKIVGIGDVCIKTNVGSTVMLKMCDIFQI